MKVTRILINTGKISLSLLLPLLIIFACVYFYEPNNNRPVTGQPLHISRYSTQQVTATLNHPINVAAPGAVQKDIPYGPEARQTLDFYQPLTQNHATAPAPAVIYIHGGGFEKGDKSGCYEPDKSTFLHNGIAVICINYRYMQQAPLQEILRDIARSVQFVRTRATDFNIDPQRIAAYGDSAGAGSSLWLNFTDDLAEPSSDDIVLRQSTRLIAAGAIETQASYNFQRWPEILGFPYSLTWIGKNSFFKGFMDNHKRLLGYDFFAINQSQEGRNINAFLDITQQIDANDPPVMLYSAEHAAITNDLLHHPKHSEYVLKICTQQGASCERIVEPTIRSHRHVIVEFLIDKLQPESNTRTANT